MKQVTIFLGLICMILGVLWWAIGGTALAIAVGIVLLTGLIVMSFGLGSWWSSRLMAQGAKLALEAQVNDNRQNNVMSSLMREIFRAGSPQIGGDRFPALPPEDTIDATFTVSGLDDEA